MYIFKPRLFIIRAIYWLICIAIVAGIFYFLLNPGPAEDNGFDLSDASISSHDIYHRAIPRNGIPSIDTPKFVTSAVANYLKPDDRILGLDYQGIKRAYPIKILNHHEIINDRINNVPIVISYNPFSGSGFAFSPGSEYKNATFGVSGLIYNNDSLLYDRATESLWSPILGLAVTGKRNRLKLRPLVLQNTTWKHWIQQHPLTEVLSNQTGFDFNYAQHPYGLYDFQHKLFFPVQSKNTRFHPKERIFGLTIGDQHKAYAATELSKLKIDEFKDQFAEQALTILYDDDSQSALFLDQHNKPLPSISIYWFAWYAFYPNTEIFTAEK